MKRIILIFTVLCLCFLISCQISIDKGDTDTQKDTLTDFGTNTGKDTSSNDVITDTDSDIITDSDIVDTESDIITDTDINTDIITDTDINTDISTDTDIDTDISTDTDIDTDISTDKEKIYVITVIDQDGEAVKDAIVSIYDDLGDIIKTLTTNSEGKAVCSLKGSYFADIDSLPSGYTDSMPYCNLEENTVITVHNSNPNGSENRPYLLTSGLATYTVKAGKNLFFTIGEGDGRVFRIRDAKGLSLKYNNTVYASNENDEIILTLNNSGEAVIVLEGTSDKDTVITIEIFYEKTEIIKAESIQLHTSKEALASSESHKYFKWVADRDGMVMVLSMSENNDISLYNKSLDAWSQSTRGAMCQYMYARENDEIYVKVASLTNEEAIVQFAIYSLDATLIDNSIPIMDKLTTIALPSNKRMFFMINEAECTLKIQGEGKLYYNDEEYDISSLDSIILQSQEDGMPIFIEIENTSDALESYIVTVE